MSAPRKQPQPKYVKELEGILIEFKGFADPQNGEGNMLCEGNMALIRGFRKAGPNIKGDERGLLDFMRRMQKLKKVFFNGDEIDMYEGGADDEQKEKIQDLSEIFTNLGNDLIKNVENGNISRFIKALGPNTIVKYIKSIDTVFELDFEKDDKISNKDGGQLPGQYGDFSQTELDSEGDFQKNNITQGDTVMMFKAVGSNLKFKGDAFTGNQVLAANSSTIASMISSVETVRMKAPPTLSQATIKTLGWSGETKPSRHFDAMTVDAMILESLREE